jgi:hypothetical protein
MEIKKKAKLVFTSRLTPREAEPKAEQPGLPVSSEVLFRTTVSNVGGRTWEGGPIEINPTIPTYPVYPKP